MQTFYSTFLIMAYDPAPPPPTIVPYIHEPRFAPGSCIGVTSAQLKFNPVVKFSNPNIGPKCELYSYIDRDKWGFFCFVFKFILNKLYQFGINCSINYHRPLWLRSLLRHLLQRSLYFYCNFNFRMVQIGFSASLRGT